MITVSHDIWQKNRVQTVISGSWCSLWHRNRWFWIWTPWGL